MGGRAVFEEEGERSVVEPSLETSAVLQKVIELLRPLGAMDRRRVILAAQTFLGNPGLR